MRTYMIEYREKHHKTVNDMAKQCKCSEGIINGLESGEWITHPNIASRVAAAYELNVDQYNELISKDHKADVLPKPAPMPSGGLYGKSGWDEDFE